MHQEDVVAKQAKVKTNAMRILDKHRIPYTTCTYDDALLSAVDVAEVLGVPASQVYKTLVVFADEQRHLLVVVPGDSELDPRKVARAVGAKHVRMAPQREAERLTGLKVGGISPLALLDKHFEIYLNASAEKLDKLYINGGQRGVNLRLKVADLLMVTKAKVISATSGDKETGEQDS